jgi:hypothetical protein
MRYLALVLLALAGMTTHASAACPTPMVIKDGTGTSQNLSTTTDASGNCVTNNAAYGWAGGVLGAMANYGTSPGTVLVPGVNAFVTNSNSNGQKTMGNSSPVALASDQTVGDPCTFAAKTNVPISTSATSSQLIPAVSPTRGFICSMSLIAAAAAVVNVVEQAGACTSISGATADLGSTVPANGMSLPANGGLTLGSGSGTVIAAGTNTYVCLYQSGNAVLSGNITYVQR